MCEFFLWFFFFFKKMKMLLFMMSMSAASAAIYDGQTGSPKVDLFVDNCWTNLTFGIEGKRAMVITT